ncbi:TPA: glycosyltransferase family 4 protein [Vibrio cholerae]|uniref:glycosyltransferase family 4 protein n=1 Tax=Vibrio cholerae TaxID=666 RepID=UPI00163B781F|nr:glycosyltransferase family 4 protein [Vibrio cholerae]ELW1717333.1 glycosyltransferase family 4 protein [Vibrio cholerae]EMC8146065.1 glycosyltransferase family 4 protein [Vibrio cholerae]HDL9468959.1 glycosyltransferase family 4 protein [Vibrio cholerae]
MLLKVKILVRYYFFYAKYFFDIKKSMRGFGKSEKHLVAVSHDLSKTGAPMLLLHILKELSCRGWNITLISMCAGPLIKEFSKVSDIYISRKPKKFCERIARCESKSGNVLINSVISGSWCKEFKDINFNVVSLVHELPGAIDYWKAGESAKNMNIFSDVIYFPSTFVKNKFQNNFGEAENTKVQPQGVFLTQESDILSDDALTLIRRKYKLDEKPIVLNVANGNFRKGFDLFLKLSHLCPDLNFVWAGDLDRGMKALARSESTSNLHLLGYISQKNELLNLYSAASVLALTSREEPFGSIVLEAMSQGTPVIGFKDVGGFQDVVRNWDTGFLTELEDLEDMSDKIRLISFDRNLHMIMSNNCKKEMSNYSFDSYVSNIEKEFSQTHV